MLQSTAPGARRIYKRDTADHKIFMWPSRLFAGTRGGMAKFVEENDAKERQVFKTAKIGE